MLLRVRCPAKVNLFLSVGPKDARNYHPLRTIFQAIELSDTLLIRDGEDRHVVDCDDPEVPDDNTVTKALRLLSEVLPLPRLHVTIEKRIPAESGLGGGSSNAAGMIRAAQRIAGLTIPDGELKGIAEAIGMDVPFFLLGGQARAEGYGERLTALPDPEPVWLAVARPSVGCKTAQAYARLDAINRDWRPFSEEDVLYNDFERVAPTECTKFIEKMGELGARDAALTGSGSAVFGRFDSGDAAKTAAERLEDDCQARTWVTRYLGRSESLRIDE
ncbi:MAG: 4-(cytidine 5'-diphospho)-2-C-methyl-D-erythritol kinase [Fimbriimonas sp.]|nr:4-(cytidine 5'-diphospho)-2-C-methyl-D-erythritol kinase [Fimbriimonas sp.]